MNTADNFCWLVCVTSYLEYRHPPWSEDKYEYTTEHWHVFAARFVFIVCYEVSHCNNFVYYYCCCSENFRSRVTRSLT